MSPPDPRLALHALNNAVAVLRMRAALARDAATDPAAAAELERIDDAADDVARAAQAVAAALREEPPVAGEPRPDAAEAAAGAVPATVALVDDDRVLRALLHRVLAGAGHRVRAFDDAEAAAVWLEGAQPVDLLICDLELSRHDGHWLIHHARSRHPRLPVLLVTGHPDAPAAGADAVLRKPVAPAVLLEAVAGLLPGPATGAGAVSPPPTPADAAPGRRTSPSA